MTREEAKKFEFFQHDREDIEKHIDKIYDDFESEKTCNNCKWYNEPICSASKCEDINELGQYVVRPTFGCNEWEGKVND